MHHAKLCYLVFEIFISKKKGLFTLKSVITIKSTHKGVVVIISILHCIYKNCHLLQKVEGRGGSNELQNDRYLPPWQNVL